MFKRSMTVLLALAAGLLSWPTFAADGLYLGVTGGVVTNDRSGFDNAVNGGVLVGYEFLDLKIADLAAEGVYTTTLSEGDVSGVPGDWDVDTIAAYGVLRTVGPIYLKGRAGVARSKAQTSVRSYDNTDFSAGLGAGFSVGIAQFEFDYTFVSDDLSFIGLTLNIKTPL